MSRARRENTLETGRWTNAMRALRSRNYRLFFGGQTTSMIGTWMTRIAMSWLVYRLTDSALLLGIVGFAGQVPAFFLAPLAGVWVDRWDRHRTLVVTQVLSMVQSFALAGLALSGTINMPWIVGLALFQGLINAFDMPARQAFVVEMIDDRADLGNAIALNSSIVNGSRLIGPAIAGFVIAAVGEGYCFLIDGVSYIAVIASLLAMRLARRPARVSEKRVLHELADGWRYVIESPAIRPLLLLIAISSLMGMPYSVLMPLMAGNVLHGGANTLGLLMGASGVGAFLSAASLALRRSVLGLGRMIAISSGMLGGGLILFGISRILWVSMLIMLAVGFGLMQQLAASNTILQTIVEDGKRGRVMAFYTLAVLGIAPFGSLLAGEIAAHIGAPETMMLGGSVCLIGSIWFALHLPRLRSAIRPIYAQLGILPEIASGVQSASALQTPPEG
ncbi:MAG: MFS transporter [Bryobacteraceae bacterium]